MSEVADIDTIVTETGAEITVCQPHQFELCHKCCMDFSEMNNDARAHAYLSNAAKKHKNGDHLGPGRLRTGTEVRMPDQSGRKPPKPIDGRIMCVVEDTEEGSDFCGQICYVVRPRDDTLMTYPVDRVHDEWLVRVNGGYIPVSNVLKLISWE